LPKQGILEHMIIYNQPEMLKEVLKDPFYKWNNNFIFEYISKKLTDKEKGLLIDEEELE
jgi:hypothetical protein